MYFVTKIIDYLMIKENESGTNFERYALYNIKFNIMKKLFLISTAIILTFLMSCRSESDSESSQLMLTGTWRPDRIVTTITANGGSTSSITEVNDCQQKSRIMFATESTGNLKYYDNVNTACSIIFDVDFTYSYNPSTKAFSITTNGNKMDGEVTSLTNDKMVVYYVDKSNPQTTTKVEITATKVTN